MFRYRGVVEGFYGRPWSHEERLMLMEWMGNKGYTHYIYAPKADSYHRANWRKPYPSEEMANLSQLIQTAKDAGVEFGFALSPGLSMVYSNPEERETLLNKLFSFGDKGVRLFGLFFDDIPLELHHSEDRAVYSGLAIAQSEVVNELYVKLKERYGSVEMIFCPTVYCGTGEDIYLVELGANLNPEIQVFWTGPQICSRTLTCADMEQVSKALGRKPVIWDNYPVNDAMMISELHIGPYLGRETGLSELLDGFFINPMNQIYTSLVILNGIGSFLHRPEDFDPEVELRRGISEELGAELVDDFYHFVQYNLTSPLHQPEMNSYYELWKQGKFQLLENEAEEIKAVAERLKAGLRDKPIYHEIQSWLKELEFWGQLGGKAVTVQKALNELFHYNPQGLKGLGSFTRLQLEMNRLRRLLRATAKLKTAVGGTLILDYGLRIHRNVEGLLQTYVDKRGTLFKNFRRVLRRL